jgi:hypothetical protein
MRKVAELTRRGPKPTLREPVRTLILIEKEDRRKLQRAADAAGKYLGTYLRDVLAREANGR